MKKSNFWLRAGALRWSRFLGFKRWLVMPGLGVAGSKKRDEVEKNSTESCLISSEIGALQS
jgi:hypothetical protein